MSSTLTNKKTESNNLNSHFAQVKYLGLMLVFCCQFSAAAELKGFQEMATAIDGRAVKLLYKLAGNSYELKYDQPGNFQLTLEPKELFNIDKTGPNTFTATLVNPKAMWAKYEDQPFKLKWFIIEVTQ